jgi:branched-chain amino acid transport system substrate-binding protein
VFLTQTFSIISVAFFWGGIAMQHGKLNLSVIAAATLSAVIFAPLAQAEDNLKVGLITSLSGSAAVLGQQMRNGFTLAVKTLGGKLGGREVEVVIADDEGKPDVAVGRVKALIDRDKAEFVVGPIFSNILAAIIKPVTETGNFLISPNAGSSVYAGKDCNPNFFVTSYQNDQVHNILGQYAQDSKIKSVLIIVPNYQAGKDADVGFKQKYTGEILDEIFVPIGQSDYSAEISMIAAAKPEALFAFLPGGMGVSFVKQFRQAGLADKITVLSAFTVDEATLPAQQDAALGMYSGGAWAPNLDSPQNKAFVDAYIKEHNAVPATYSFQAYDAALLIDSAVRTVKGNLADKDAVRAALQAADFQSLRGSFKFNNNHYPIQDFYLTKVAKRSDGRFETEIEKKVFTNYGDAFAKDCPMK